MSGNFWVSYEGCQVPFRTSGRIMGLPLRCRSGQGSRLLHPWGFQAGVLEWGAIAFSAPALQVDALAAELPGKPLMTRWPLELLRGSQAPRRAVCGTRGSLRTMHGGGSAPSCCAFTHRVAFEDGIVLWVRQEKKALTSRGWGLLRGFLELWRPWVEAGGSRRTFQTALNKTISTHVSEAHYIIQCSPCTSHVGH